MSGSNPYRHPEIEKQCSDMLFEFLKPCLDTPTLQNLTIDLLNSDRDSEWPQAEISQALLLLLRKTTASFEQTYTIPYSADQWYLEEALEVLRKKSYQAVSILAPAGAECDDLSPEDIGKSYILRHTTTNPVRALLDYLDIVIRGTNGADGVEHAVEILEGPDGYPENPEGNAD
ncbi:hypothetical protein B0T24DRAFT_596140 [Lasiosphaeria ovina]|uniref:Uncharacterized protein n=1 Tax=Lasiosphaeria ovina TaxID=92902 RepID=A0AAE0K3F1_9PEZI|nr:hypothetical protein B0T24DRAFT_596140 [Lasiosphaeria ovina]